MNTREQKVEYLKELTNEKLIQMFEIVYGIFATNSDGTGSEDVEIVKSEIISRMSK